MPQVLVLSGRPPAHVKMDEGRKKKGFENVSRYVRQIGDRSEAVSEIFEPALLGPNLRQMRLQASSCHAAVVRPSA